MKPRLTLRNVILAVFLSSTAHAQIVKPIDVTKQADVSGKTVSFGNVQFDTLSQPMSDLPGSPPSKGVVKFQDVDQKKTDANPKKMDFKTLDMSAVSEPTVPKANFAAKRAEVDVPSAETKKQADQAKKQADQARKQAPINDRQIRPFNPAGEEDLKHQLNEPLLGVH